MVFVPAQIEGAHTLGAMGVSWAPAVPRGSLTSGKAPGPPVRRFASGGCDNIVKVREREREREILHCSSLTQADWRS